MKSKERVFLAINHREADRIPTGEITIADEVVRAFLGVEGVGFSERVEVVNRLGIDAVCASPEWPMQPSCLPDPAEVRWKDLYAWATQTDRFVFAVLDGVFGWGMRLMEFEKFLAASFRKSQNLIDLLHEVEGFNITLAKHAVIAGADGILIADDIAYRQSTTVSPTLLRELFFPSLARQVNGIAPLEVPVFFHSDGNLNGVIDDLVAIGFQGLQGIESEAGMDLARLKAAYGGRVCLWGNLDPGDLFMDRNAEDLQKSVQDIIEGATGGGGFIFGTSSGLVGGMRPENINVVYQAVLSPVRCEKR